MRVVSLPANCYVHSWTLGGNFLLLYAVDLFLLRSHQGQLVDGVLMVVQD